jgi:hypothetical protein
MIVLGLITYLSFQSRTETSCKLYNSWILDNTSDIYIYNNPRYSSFCKTRDTVSGDRIVSRSSVYQIKVYRTVKINIETPCRRRYLELTNIALAPGFISNLVLLNLLNIRDVYWNSEYPKQITYKGGVLCSLEKIDLYWVFERDIPIVESGGTATVLVSAKSKKTRKLKLTAA